MSDASYVPPDPPIVPYLCVTPARDAVAWYGRAFGATPGEVYDMDDGRVGHATLTLANGAELYLADDFPEMIETVGTTAPQALGGTTVTLALAVDDADAWMARAEAEGAMIIRPASDQFFGRNGKLRDPFGQVWSITGPLKGG